MQNVSLLVLRRECVLIPATGPEISGCLTSLMETRGAVVITGPMTLIGEGESRHFFTMITQDTLLICAAPTYGALITYLRSVYPHIDGPCSDADFQDYLMEFGMKRGYVAQIATLDQLVEDFEGLTGIAVEAEAFRTMLAPTPTRPAIGTL